MFGVFLNFCGVFFLLLFLLGTIIWKCNDSLGGYLQLEWKDYCINKADYIHIILV